MAGGKYLRPEERVRLTRERQRRRRERRRRRGELLLMLAIITVAGGQLEAPWGVGVTAVLSAYFGYQLKGV